MKHDNIEFNNVLQEMYIYCHKMSCLQRQKLFSFKDSL